MIWLAIIVLITLAAAWLFRDQIQERLQGQLHAPPAPAPPSSTRLSGDVELAVGEKLNVLEGTGGDVRGRDYFIGMRTVTIGREQNNFVQTIDKKASRRHCQLKAVEGGLLLTDMHSSNGTRVNEELIESHILLDGDVIRIGRATFLYHRKRALQRDASREHKEVGKWVNRETVQSVQSPFDPSGKTEPPTPSER